MVIQRETAAPPPEEDKAPQASMKATGWTVGRKLALAFGMGLVLLIAVTGVGVFALNQTYASTHEIVDEHVPSLMDIAHLESDILKARQEIGAYVTTGHEEHLDHAAHSHEEVEEHLAELRGRFHSEEEYQLMSSVSTAHEELDAGLENIVAYCDANPADLDGVFSRLHELDHYMEDEVLVSIEKLYEFEIAETQALDAAAEEQYLGTRVGSFSLAGKLRELVEQYQV